MRTILSSGTSRIKLVEDHYSSFLHNLLDICTILFVINALFLNIVNNKVSFFFIVSKLLANDSKKKNFLETHLYGNLDAQLSSARFKTARMLRYIAS